MSWWQLTLEADGSQSGQLEELLLELGAASVTLDDAGDEALFELAPGNMPRWSAIRLTGLFADEMALLAVLAQLPERLDSPLPRYQISTFEDEPWERSWMDRFQPIRCGERLWICPSWRQVDQPDAVVLRLDPGLAFGTGSHPTTQLCLGWLDRHNLTGLRVIDYGCGSGILAIAALLLGAEQAVAIDIDPQALLATSENGARNQIAAERLAIFTTEAAPAMTADLLLANILAGPLISLAPHLAQLLLPGGALVLSGILAEQAESVAAAYRPWFDLTPPTFEQEWTLLTGIKRVDST